MLIPYAFEIFQQKHCNKVWKGGQVNSFNKDSNSMNDWTRYRYTSPEIYVQSTVGELAALTFMKNVTYTIFC